MPQVTTYWVVSRAMLCAPRDQRSNKPMWTAAVVVDRTLRHHSATPCACERGPKARVAWARDGACGEADTGANLAPWARHWGTKAPDRGKPHKGKQYGPPDMQAHRKGKKVLHTPCRTEQGLQPLKNDGGMPSGTRLGHDPGERRPQAGEGTPGIQGGKQ